MSSDHVCNRIVEAMFSDRCTVSRFLPNTSLPQLPPILQFRGRPTVHSTYDYDEHDASYFIHTMK